MNSARMFCRPSLGRQNGGASVWVPVPRQINGVCNMGLRQLPKHSGEYLLEVLLQSFGVLVRLTTDAIFNSPQMAKKSQSNPERL
jgi:hypothetical protein